MVASTCLHKSAGFGAEYEVLKFVADRESFEIGSVKQILAFSQEKNVLYEELARKMKGLVKKYSSSRERQERAFHKKLHPDSSGPSLASISVGGDATHSTLQMAWCLLLEAVDSDAEHFLSHANQAAAGPLAQLRLLVDRQVEAKKQSIRFAYQILSEKQRALDLLKADKERYFASCQIVQNFKDRHDKIPDTPNVARARERVKAKWSDAIIDMGHLKNEYLATLECASSANRIYACKNLAVLVRQMRDETQTITEHVAKLIGNHVDLESCFFESHARRIASNQHVVKSINPAEDSESWWKHVLASNAFTEPPHFTMEQNGVWKDEEGFVLTEKATNYLRNKRYQVKGMMDALQIKTDAKYTELAALEALHSLCVRGEATCSSTSAAKISPILSPVAKNAGKTEVDESLVVYTRDILISETNLDALKTRLYVIDRELGIIDGVDPLAAQVHEMVPTGFAIPHTCKVCRDFIWGGVRSGLSCRYCGFQCHARCGLKVPQTCKATAPRPNTVRAADSSVSRANRLSNTPSVVHETAPVMQSPIPTQTVGSESTDTLVISPFSTGDLVRALYAFTATNDDLSPLVSNPSDPLSPDLLAVTEGDSLEVVAPDSGNGWTNVRAGNGIMGHIPTSYITGIIKNISKKDVMTDKSEADNSTCNTGEEKMAEITRKTQARYKMKMAYSYQSKSFNELSLAAEDIIWVLEEDDGSGWVVGFKENSQKKGLVPSSYLIAFEDEQPC